MKNTEFALKPRIFPSGVTRPSSPPEAGCLPPERRAAISQPRVTPEQAPSNALRSLGLGHYTQSNRKKEHGTNSLIAMETAKHQAQAQGRPATQTQPDRGSSSALLSAAHSQLLLCHWGWGRKRHFSAGSLVKCFLWLPLADAVYKMPHP